MEGCEPARDNALIEMYCHRSIQHPIAYSIWPRSGNDVRILSVGLPLVNNALMEIPGALRFLARDL